MSPANIILSRNCRSKYLQYVFYKQIKILQIFVYLYILQFMWPRQLHQRCEDFSAPVSNSWSSFVFLYNHKTLYSWRHCYRWLWFIISGRLRCNAGDSDGSDWELEMGVDSLPPHGLHQLLIRSVDNYHFESQIVIWATSLLFVPETPAHFIRWAVIHLGLSVVGGNLAAIKRTSILLTCTITTISRLTP